MTEKKLTDEQLKQVSGGAGKTQEPTSNDWTICPKCGGTLVPYEMATKPWPQYKCLSCHIIFDDNPGDPNNPGEPKIYL